MQYRTVQGMLIGTDQQGHVYRFNKHSYMPIMLSEHYYPIQPRYAHMYTYIQLHKTLTREEMADEIAFQAPNCMFPNGCTSRTLYQLPEPLFEKILNVAMKEGRGVGPTTGYHIFN